MTEPSLEMIFSPRSVAVIGASRKRGTIGAEIFHNLLTRRFEGVVYPVNPKADSVLAVRAYPSILEIPDPVDLAVIVVPAAHVLAVAEECVRKKVKAMVVISAGFRETGTEGLAREEQLLKICRDAEIRLVGPNCLGVLNTDPEVSLDATFAPTYPPEGNVAFLSQSGALGLAILDYAKELGIGISKFVSVGNKADVSGNDLIHYWDRDPKTDVILLYLESFGNSRRFLARARDISHRKPIVAVKSGRSASGARAAASHTGALAGSDALVDALFRQTGVIRVDTVEELFDMAMILAHQPLPKGNRIGILTNAGGPAIMAADACEKWGLVVPEIDEKTRQEIRQHLVPEASVRNPVDMIASASPEAFSNVIPILLKNAAIDALLVIYVPPIVTKPKEIAEAIVGASEESDKPVITCFMGRRGVPEGLRSLKAGHIPSYAFPEAAVAALARASAYSEWRGESKGEPVRFADVQTKRIETLCAGVPTSQEGRWLLPGEAFDLLDAAGIRTARPRLASTPEGAAREAQGMGFPVVLKIDSAKALHKTEIGGVALDLKGAGEVEQSARQMINRAEKAGIPLAEIRGFTVQPMITGGVEVIVGGGTDLKMGPFLMLGLGGVEVEILKDVAFRLCPVTRFDVEEMIRGLRGYKVFEGFRGRPPSDLKALTEILLRLNDLRVRCETLREFDLNPVKVLSEGKGAIVLDARVRIAS